MRVLVYGLSSDKLGGIETFLLNMNKFMSDDMIFDYVIEGTDTIHRQSIEEKGGHCYFIAPKRNIMQNLCDWETLLRQYKTFGNIVYFNMFSLAWSIPIFKCLSHKYKVIVHAHNNNLHDCGVVLKLMHRISRTVLRATPIVRFTNSDLSSAFFFGNKKSELIYNAIDVDRFCFDPIIREKMRTQFKIQNKNVYGFSGRLAYQKNPEFLIDVFAAIRKLDINASFVICGDGDLADTVKARANEKGLEILFTGNVQNIQDYYQTMDCYILPSRFEGLGIVLIEAQCCGLPCLTSKNVVPQIVRETDLLTFVSLNTTAEQWAKKAIESVGKGVLNRTQYYLQIKQSNFNIVNEAARLERILKSSEV